MEKMAAEGYVFAKLPKCYLMPQLRDWVMYREGVVFSETAKSIFRSYNYDAIYSSFFCSPSIFLTVYSIFIENLMRATIAIWKLMETKGTPKIEGPSLHMTKYQLKKLSYDQAEEMKKKVYIIYSPISQFTNKNAEIYRFLT